MIIDWLKAIKINKVDEKNIKNNLTKKVIYPK